MERESCVTTNTRRIWAGFASNHKSRWYFGWGVVDSAVGAIFKDGIRNVLTMIELLEYTWGKGEKCRRIRSEWQSRCLEGKLLRDI